MVKSTNKINQTSSPGGKFGKLSPIIEPKNAKNCVIINKMNFILLCICLQKNYFFFVCSPRLALRGVNSVLFQREKKAICIAKNLRVLTVRYKFFNDIQLVHFRLLVIWRFSIVLLSESVIV